MITIDIPIWLLTLITGYIAGVASPLLLAAWVNRKPKKGETDERMDQR